MKLRSNINNNDVNNVQYLIFKSQIWIIDFKVLFVSVMFYIDQVQGVPLTYTPPPQTKL